MIIKVCGMRNPDNIREIESAGADWMGFIFYPPSCRNVEETPAYLPARCKKVGVFVNATYDFIVDKVNEFHFDFIQLHGNESPAYCQKIRTCLPKDTGIIKMFAVENDADIRVSQTYEGLVDYFLFETKCQSYGGSGKQFDWNILHSYNGATPFLITGGINPEDYDKVKAFSHPKMTGVDINSRFELAPCVKDVQLVKRFIENVKE